MDNEVQKLLCYLSINHTTEYQNIYNTALKKHLISYKIEKSIILNYIFYLDYFCYRRDRGSLAQEVSWHCILSMYL